MSTELPIGEWHIARDGRKFGPLSDAEMRKFVELGQLRQTDLLWCNRFADWRSGEAVFPHAFAAIPAPRPASPPLSAAASSQQAASQPMPHAVPQGTAPFTSHDLASANLHPAHQLPQHTATPLSHAPTYAPPEMAVAPGSGAYRSEALPEPSKKQRGAGKTILVAAAVLLLMGGFAWLAWQNRNELAHIGGGGNSASSEIPAEAFRISPYVASGTTAAAVDASLQKSAIWRLLKRDFNEWYTDRVAEVAKLRSDAVDEKVVSKYLADVIVTLRRRYAERALESSPEHLRAVAVAFSGALKQLATRDAETCQGFITYGAAHPVLIELLRQPAFAEPMQRQIFTVFAAIADGRATPAGYSTTAKGDYDVLTEQLKVHGWTEDDLKTFTDPRLLSKAPASKVCDLVQHWFKVHIEIKDEAMRARLLRDPLKPVVGG